MPPRTRCALNNTHPRQRGGLFGFSPATLARNARPEADTWRPARPPPLVGPVRRVRPTLLLRRGTRAGRGVRTMTLFDPGLHHSTSQMEQLADTPWTYCETTPTATRRMTPAVLTPAVAMNMGTVRLRSGGTRVVTADDEVPCVVAPPRPTVQFQQAPTSHALSPEPGFLPCMLCEALTLNLMSECEDRVCRTCLRVWWANFPNMRNKCPYCRETRNVVTDLTYSPE